MAASAVGDIRESLPGSSFFSQTKSKNGHGGVAQAASAASVAYYSDKPLATPATRKLARDMGIDLRRVPPTGAGGRVTKDDLRTFTGGGAVQSVTQHAPAPVAQTRGAQPSQGGLEERKPFVGLRRRIAERMRTAVRSRPMTTTPGGVNAVQRSTAPPSAPWRAPPSTAGAPRRSASRARGRRRAF